MAIDGMGRFLYQPDGSSFDIYSIDQGSGMLSKTANTTLAPVGDFTVASNDGRFLFNAGKGLVEAASIDQSSGQLTSSGAPVPAGGSAGPMVVSRDGRFLYVANETQGNVAVFNVGSNGGLTAVTGSPFTTDGGARGISLTPDGKFLYVEFNESNVVSTVKGYAVNPAGTFTAIAGAVVNNASTVTVDGSGRVAYISESGLLSTYTIDAATGALTRASQAAQPISEDPMNMAVVQ
jgi:6-phosphogluconolactonase (cycloisomerase 2 family)